MNVVDDRQNERSEFNMGFRFFLTRLSAIQVLCTMYMSVSVYGIPNSLVNNSVLNGCI